MGLLPGCLLRAAGGHFARVFLKAAARSKLSYLTICTNRRASVIRFANPESLSRIMNHLFCVIVKTDSCFVLAALDCGGALCVVGITVDNGKSSLALAFF